MLLLNCYMACDNYNDMSDYINIFNTFSLFLPTTLVMFL